MPKVTINEIDSSRFVVPSEEAPMTVLVPGTASFGPTFDSANPMVSVFNGESDLPNFFNAYGYNPAHDSNGKTLSGDLSYEYATNLLRSGAQILFYRLNVGTEASATIEYTDDSTSVETTVKADYAGRFGNTLVVSVDKDPYDTNAGVLSIYGSPTEYSEAFSGDFALNGLSRLYYGRVSTDEDSQYYVGTLDNGFVTISEENLRVILDSIAATGDSATTCTFNLFGGTDFGPGESATSIVSALEASYSNFADPYLFEFDIITCGGLIGLTANSGTSGTYVTVNNEMLALAKTRGDCLAILDTPQTFSYIEVVNYASTNAVNSSYGAIYAPWCSFVSTTTGKTQMMPPSIVFLKALLLGMQSQIQPELWYVPAGVTRTSAPFIVDTAYEIGSTILDAFQNDNDYRVNPIMRLRNYGYCVYGNATCMRAIPGLPHSALESLNVRLISNVIKKAIFNVCCGLSFEYNNSDLWLKFYTQMDEKLLYMKRHYGLYDYRIEMGVSTVTTADLNERRVPGKVIISPTLAGEYFDIDFEIMPSGVTFTEEEVQ